MHGASPGHSEYAIGYADVAGSIPFCLYPTGDPDQQRPSGLCDADSPKTIVLQVISSAFFF
jgi:hypothetical protein